MAATYEITLAIRVWKKDTEEAVVEEDNFFTDLSFGLMANVADEFYELVSRLRKKK